MIDENLMKFIENYPKLVKSLISHNLFNFNLRKRLKSFSKILQSSDFSLEQSNDIFTEYFDATVCLRTNYLNATCPVEINISKLRKKVINKPTVNIVTEQLYNLVLDSTKNEYDPLFNSNINDEPVLLLHDKIFDYQIIDGNHRTIRNYQCNNYYTGAVMLNTFDILDCIDNNIYKEIIYVFLTIFLYLLKCPQSLILSALRAFCFCGKPHISRSIFLYFRYQAWLKSW